MSLQKTRRHESRHLRDSARGQPCLCYKLTFPNGKSYIGITNKTLQERIARHVRDAKTKASYPIHHAINKYGVGDIKSEILAHIDSWELACIIEMEFIVTHGTKCPCGYNATDGGEGVVGGRQTDESNRKRRLALLGNKNHNYGKTMPEAVKNKISIAKKGCSTHNKGKKNTELGLRNIGNKYGRKNKGKVSHKRIPVTAINIKTGERFVFDSQFSAANYVGCISNSVSNCLSGRRISANGFMFERGF